MVLSVDRPQKHNPEHFQSVLPVGSTVSEKDKTTRRFSVIDGSWLTRFDWSKWEAYDMCFDISDEAIDATRINAGTALFTDGHRDDRRIGKITGYSIEDGKVYFDVKIGTSEWGQRYLQECEDGVEPGKSVEVFIEELEEVEPAEYEGEGWDRRMTKRAKRKATKYQFSGVSTVTTPAIGTVGFGAEEVMELAIMRSQFHQQFESLQGKLNRLEKLSTMSQPQVQSLEAGAPASPSDQPQEQSSNTIEVESLKAELSAMQAELAAQRAQTRKEGIQRFMSEQAGRITPAMRDFSHNGMNLGAFMQSLPDSQLEWLQSWCKSCLHQSVPTLPVMPPGEFSSNGHGQKKALNPSELAAMAKKKVDEFSAQGRHLTYSEAIDLVMGEHGVAVR